MNGNESKLIIAASIAVCSMSVFAKQNKTRLPNIVLINCDDLGYGDLSCYGASQYKTPNLDQLAVQGMRFTSFLSAQAVSSASRAGLLTGCYPNRVGIEGALFPDSRTGLNQDEETIAELLKKRNYKTSAIGKWHLGSLHEFLPLQHGFDEYFGIPYSNDMWPVYYDGVPYAINKRENKYNFPPLPLIQDNTVIRELNSLEDQSEITTLYTEKAVKFINENKKSPFFLYIAHSMPHVPLAVSKKFKGKSEQGLYGDVIMEIDWSVGEIMKTLKKNKLDKNTLVVFTSDNGPWILYGNHAGSSGGFREGKITAFEGGFRVPCIMYWPPLIPKGTICNKLTSAIDLLPTFASITKIPLSENKIDGVDISSLLYGDETVNPRETFLYYVKPNRLVAVRKGEWKLVFAHKGLTNVGYRPGLNGFPGTVNGNFDFQESLYDLRRDPGEKYDVKDFYPEVLSELRKIADGAREDLGDDLQNVQGKNRRKSGYVE